jgi:hypothetical protein
LKTDQPTQPVHLLEAGADETHDGGRDLRGGKIPTDPPRHPLRRVKERQEERHTRPHAGLDRAQEETQGIISGGIRHAHHGGPDDADADDDAGEPGRGGQFTHGQIGRHFQHDIGDVEEGQTGGDLVRGDVEVSAQVVAGGEVHRLGQADVGSDGAAEEIEQPEGRDDAEVELAVDVAHT